MKKVGNERPDQKIVKSIEQFFGAIHDSIQDTVIPQILPDASDKAKTELFFKESVSRMKETGKEIRCSLNISPLVLLKNTSSISLDSAENLEHYFLEMPFYSIVLVFHKQFEDWIARRERFVDLYKLRMEKSAESVKMQKIDNARKLFPWKKIPMPIDTEIAALKGCQIPRVNSLAESAQRLIDQCNSASKIGKGSDTKSE